ncbi:predicted protein [Nematostella vectensis]|uniref:TLC domain-containing protein n=1 Tax=Nematostella vectensis TaxID=45351 RepID=A7SM93_NEMVE|nr:TLC domain-containing protein 2 [Nematostella vectensis]EDO35196.1 predicted protein [Nematostella vectensis]|eukprot:XP_001627296.1 predicted protein [Nematostella vectensis]
MTDLLALPPGLVPISLSFLLFRGLHAILSKYIALPNSIVHGPRRKQWLYYNISISLIHSTVTAIWSLYCFYNEPAMLSDMIGVWTSSSYFLLCLSTGYFLHDFLDMLLNDLSRSTVLLIHHTLVVVAFLIAILTKNYCGYGTCSLLMEVNSVFLHSRRIMLFHDVDRKSTLYELNGLLMLATFVFFRFLTSAWMMNFVIKARHIIPATHVFYGGFAMAAMIIMNIQLFTQLWNADFAKDKKRQAASDD